MTSGKFIRLLESVFLFEIIHQKPVRRYGFSDIIDHLRVLMRADGQGRGDMLDTALLRAGSSCGKPHPETGVAAQAAFRLVFKAGDTFLPSAVVISAFDQRDIVYAAHVNSDVQPALIFVSRLDIRIIKKTRNAAAFGLELFNAPARAYPAANM